MCFGFFLNLKNTITGLNSDAVCFCVPSRVESGGHLTLCAWIECLTGVKSNMETVHTKCCWNTAQPYTEKHFKQAASGCFLSYHREEKKLIRTGRLGSGFSSTAIFPSNDCSLNLDFFFPQKLFFFVQTLSSFTCFFSWVKVGIVVRREGEREKGLFFHVCRNVDFFPPWNPNCALEGC